MTRKQNTHMCNEFLTPVTVRNWISFQCFLSVSPAHCLFKGHRYMNHENEAGIYARPESRDQFRKVSKKICKFHSKAPVLESLFNKFTGFQT